MKPSIACIALLASLLACSHGIEQQVRRLEMPASDSLFENPEDYGSEVRQSYGTLTPTASYSYTTPPPTPVEDPCESCGIVIAPFDIVGFRNEIEAVANEYIGSFTALLSASTCEPDNSPSCVQGLLDFAVYLQKFQDEVDSTLSELDSLICLDSFIDSSIPQCPIDGLELSVANATSDGRRLETEQVTGVRGNVFRALGGQTSTDDQATLIRAGRNAVSAAEKLLNAVAECGGVIFVTGDGCAVAVSALKIGFAAGIVLADTKLTIAEDDLARLEGVNAGLDFEFVSTTHGNVIEAHFKLDTIQDGINEALTKLDSIQKGVDEANEKLDKLLCPFGPAPGALFTVLGQGCDSTDQNCNGVPDECAEDNVPPSIALKVPPPAIPFKSVDDALAFLFENVIVSDDCAVKFQTGFFLRSEPNCCDCQFQVTTADERCVNDNAPGMATASRFFVLKVDNAAPVITCGFFTQQDPFHVSGGFDPCGGLPVPFPGTNDPLHIDQNCFGQGLFDVALWYQIEDECDDGVLPVTVRVLSNELEGRPVEEKMTFIVERNDLPNAVHRAEVYLSPTSCQDDKTGGSKGSKNSGKGASTICKIEEAENGSVTTRFYDITISATDAAGNVGTKTCSVIVIPDDHYCSGGNGTEVGGLNSSKKCGSKGAKGIQNGGQRGVRHLASFDDLSSRNLQQPKKVTKGSKGLLNNEHDPDDLRKEYALSTQRYVISELLLEWDPNLDTNLAVPSLPEPETNVGSSKAKTGKGKGSKSGRRSCPVSCEGAQGKKGKKQVDGVKNGINPP